MKKLAVPAFLYEALTICGFGLPIAGLFMASVLLSYPVGPCDTFVGGCLIIFSLVLFTVTVRYCIAQQQLQQPNQAQLAAEAELQEDIEFYNNQMTPLERQLYHRITYNRAQQRIRFGADTTYEDEEDFDNEAERQQETRQALEAIGN